MRRRGYKRKGKEKTLDPDQVGDDEKGGGSGYYEILRLRLRMTEGEKQKLRDSSLRSE